MGDSVYECRGLDRPGCLITEWAEDGWCHWCGRRLTPKFKTTEGQVKTVMVALHQPERWSWQEPDGCVKKSHMGDDYCARHNQDWPCGGGE